mmetsp:Transcript_18957/g.61834  ORF Transcript_18957/g.61834 Transcript_18957/m.61834 type:complete len:238 (-) Transcript_18957:6-719(-)
MSASKRPLAVRRLKIVLVPGGAHAITVQPDERDKTVHDWLVCLLEPVEDAAPLDAMTLKIQHDVAYESLVEPNTTLEEVGLFVKESGTVVLKVSAVMNGSVQKLRPRDPFGVLFRRIQQEEWGRSVGDGAGGRQAMDARDQAISQAIAEMGGEGVEEQLRFVKSRVLAHFATTKQDGVAAPAEPGAPRPHLAPIIAPPGATLRFTPRHALCRGAHCTLRPVLSPSRAYSGHQPSCGG